MLLHPGVEISLYAGVTTLVALWGKHRFVSKEDCVNEQDRCSSAICKKIEDLKKGQSIQIEEMKEIKFFMGQVHQYMKDNSVSRGV